MRRRPLRVFLVAVVPWALSMPACRWEEEAPGTADAGAAAALLAPAGAGSEAEALIRRAQARFGAHLPSGEAIGFERAGEILHPRFGPAGARVEATLPDRADGAIRVTDPASGLSLAATLDGARAVPAEAADGFLLFRGGHASGADVLHRAESAGVEDYLLFEAAPATREIRYTVDLGGRAAGLRLVADVLEIVDEGGAPRLRMAAPFLVGADGQRRAARTSVEGCAVDTDPAAPWGRAPVAPGAARCTVRITWDADVPSPALLDPSWTSTGAMSVRRDQFTSTLLKNGKVLAAGGLPGPLASAELYDPQTGTWATTGPMAAARYLHTASLLGSGSVLVAGGDTTAGSNRSMAATEIYDPAKGTFASSGLMWSARGGHSATVLGNGKVLIAGGTDDAAMILATTELYDPAQAKWVQLGLLNDRRFLHATSVMANGNVLLTGGVGLTGVTSAAEYFDVNLQIFLKTASMGAVRQGHTQTTLPSGKVLVTGGTYYDVNLAMTAYRNTTEIFDPMNLVWAPGANLTTARANHTATLVPGNLVVVAGGTNGAATSATDLYDPNTGLWTAMPAMAQARASHTATRLLAGQVLVAGGGGSSAEVFDVLSGNGAPCVQGTTCTSGFCVEGVCCDAACGDQCASCKVMGKVGKCSAVTGAPVAGKPACAGTPPCAGACDGVATAACAFPGAMTTCRPGSCANGVATLAEGCDGKGGCPALRTAKCEPYACGPSACLAACATDGDCAAAYFCDGQKKCAPKAGAGAPCAAASQCASGFCADGVCCNAACTGQCEACNQQGLTGACAPVTGKPVGGRPACTGDGTLCNGICDGRNGAACTFPGMGTVCRPASCANGVAQFSTTCDGKGACPQPRVQRCEPYLCGPSSCLGTCASDADCTAANFCDANHRCVPKLGRGAPCARNTQCLFNTCADGFCCNATCDGQCEACNVKGMEGTCTPVMGAPVGMRPPCTGDGTACGGACDGVNGKACVYPGNQITCRPAACINGVATIAAACDGAGNCPDPMTLDCGAFRCGQAGCLSTCASDADCAAGAYCDAKTCVKKKATGQRCAAAAQCQSGFCADGYCCNQTCSGQCSACNQAGQEGTCVPIMGDPVGMRPACPGSGPCKGVCDGVSFASCAYPGKNMECKPAWCESGIAHGASTCDGTGTCVEGSTKQCALGCGGTDCAEADSGSSGGGDKGALGGGGACAVGGRRDRIGGAWALVGAALLVGLVRRRRRGA